MGALSGSVIWQYVAGTGGVLWLTVLMFLYVGEQGSKIITDRWPGLWTQDRFDRGINDLAFYLAIYAALALLFGAITLLRSLHFTFGAVRPLHCVPGLLHAVLQSRSFSCRACRAVCVLGACFDRSWVLMWPACVERHKLACASVRVCAPPHGARCGCRCAQL